jgi:hypothetical protein
MSERPLWDWGIHFPADLLPVRQARRVLPVIIAEAVPNLLRDPRAFWEAAGLARKADLTAELEELRNRGLPVVVLWGQSDQLITRDSFEDLCTTLGKPEVVTVAGTHSWLISDPDAFGEVMTNVIDVVGMAGGGAKGAVRSKGAKGAVRSKGAKGAKAAVRSNAAKGAKAAKAAKAAVRSKGAKAVKRTEEAMRTNAG